MNTYSFIKENGNWYIAYTEELKAFNKSELALLEGAAPLLDLLSNGKRKVALAIAATPFEKTYKLELVEVCEEGGAIIPCMTIGKGL